WGRHGEKLCGKQKRRASGARLRRTGPDNSELLAFYRFRMVLGAVLTRTLWGTGSTASSVSIPGRKYPRETVKSCVVAQLGADSLLNGDRAQLGRLVRHVLAASPQSGGGC